VADGLNRTNKAALSVYSAYSVLGYTAISKRLASRAIA
jgi:hypothetical protein